MRRSTGAALVLLTAAPLMLAQGGEPDLPGTRPALAGVRAWIEPRTGKLSETEVLARLGPADRVERLGGPGDGIAMTWEETAWIRIIFRTAKARRLDGHFAPQVSSKEVSLANFHKLRPNMTHKAAEQMLGA